mmetsp:Transcript_30475/g.63398  ORF Transcript_30475/g.63398 Transcript_30475/m.63398 type:complete len:89 (+) Transcript_30475:194-460(+)
MISLCEFQDSGEFQRIIQQEKNRRSMGSRVYLILAKSGKLISESSTIAPLFFEVLSLVDRFLFAEVASQLKNGRNTLRGKRHGIVKTI